MAILDLLFPNPANLAKFETVNLAEDGAGAGAGLVTLLKYHKEKTLLSPM